MQRAAVIVLALACACARPSPRADTHSAAAETASSEPDLSQGSAQFDRSIAPGLEVVRVKTGHLLVRPIVNGHEAGWFIFDTGAGICVVSTPHLGPLGLEPAGDIQARGIGGGANAQLFRAETLSLGPVTLRNHPLMSTDLSFLKQFLGEEIAGIIGYGVLSRCVAEIDLSAPAVTLHDPEDYRLAAGAWLPIDLDDRIPALHGRFEDHEGLFHVDTGSNAAITFSENAVRKWRLLEGRDAVESKLGGVGGFTAVRKGRVEWFEVGGLRQEDVEATFPTEAKGTLGGERIDGSLGAGLLRPYVVITDYPQSRMAFRERPNAAVPAGAGTK